MRLPTLSSALSVVILALSTGGYALVAKEPQCPYAEEVAIMPPPSRLYCGTYGQVDNPQPLEPAFQHSYKNCITSCLATEGCISFAFDKKLKSCQLYSAPLRKQKYKTKTGGHVIHYNRHCFACPKACHTFETHTDYSTTTLHTTTTIAESTTTTATTQTVTAYTTGGTPGKARRSAQSTTPCATTAPTTVVVQTQTVYDATEYAKTVTQTSTAPVATQTVSVDCSVCPSFNSVNNPGFEEGTLVPWTTGGNGGSASSNSPYTGTYSFRSSDTRGSNFQDFSLTQSVFVCPGYSYTLSYVAKGTDISGFGASASTSSVIDGNATPAFPFDNELSTSYQPFSQSWGGLSAGSDARMVDITIRADGPTFEPVYADDFVFKANCPS